MKALVWICRLVVGVLFIFSGFVKANDIIGFSYKLDEYWDVFGTEFMKPGSVFLSWFISVFEIAVGFATLVGWRMKITANILLLMIVFFTFLTGWSYITGTVKECGCFGDAIKLTAGQSFAKDLILLVLILPIWLMRNKTEPVMKGMLPAIVSLGSFAGFGYFSYYCYAHLPLIDFIKGYKVGANIPENLEKINPDSGVPYAEMAPMAEMKCEGMKEFEGKTLYIITNFKKASDESLQAAVNLGNQLKGSDIKVVCYTSSISDVREAYQNKFNFPFCVVTLDDKQGKSMVRSNPGYLLLKNGTVMKKWHHNDIPTPDELQAAAK